MRIRRLKPENSAVLPRAGPASLVRAPVAHHPVLGVEQERKQAALITAQIKAGPDRVPRPLPAKHVGGRWWPVAGRYLEDHVAAHCKLRTQQTTRGVINRHIVPVLSRLPQAAVAHSYVMALHESPCEPHAMASMVVEVLSHIYALANDS